MMDLAAMGASTHPKGRAGQAVVIRSRRARATGRARGCGRWGEAGANHAATRRCEAARLRDNPKGRSIRARPAMAG